MNIKTGAIYRTKEEIDAALARGEELVRLSGNQQAAHVGMNRKARRLQAALERRARKKLRR